MTKSGKVLCANLPLFGNPKTAAWAVLPPAEEEPRTSYAEFAASNFSRAVSSAPGHDCPNPARDNGTQACLGICLPKWPDYDLPGFPMEPACCAFICRQGRALADLCPGFLWRRYRSCGHASRRFVATSARGRALRLPM